MEQLTRKEKQTFRALLFKHQDGLAITNTIAKLDKKGIFDYCKDKVRITIYDLKERFPEFHLGYLNVALRSLASQGLFEYEVRNDSVFMQITQKFNELYKYKGLYINFSEAYSPQLSLLKSKFHSDFSIDSKILQLSNQLQEIQQKNTNDPYYQDEVLIHLEGVLLLPVLVYLNFNCDYNDQDVDQVISSNRNIQLFLENLNLLKDGRFTKKGRFLFEKSYAYGVTTSYTPIMANIHEYLYGNFQKYFERDADNNEQHVFRAINVWGSGGSHNTYFKKIDEVLLDIFNRPLDEQPKGIIDVGCGNGALLEHMFNLIWNQTSRRDDLNQNKLILIGADYNKEALLSTQRNLKKSRCLG